MTKRLIIDLDSLLYRAGFSVEKTWRRMTIQGEDRFRARFSTKKEMNVWLEENGFLPGDYTVEIIKEVGPAEAAIKLFDILLAGIHDKYPDHIPEMYMGGRAAYRFDLYPEYKANRKASKKPEHYDMLYNHALVRGAVIPDGIEADDVCCIRAYQCMEDLAQIPGTHYNFVTSEELAIDPFEADYNFYTQLLTGDTSDNIPGIKGIGPKRAEALLAGCEDERDMYVVCKEQYTREMLTFCIY